MRNSYTGRWFILSVLSLGMGGAFAFLIGMSRMPGAADFFPSNYFQRALVGHVDLAILCWLMISAIVLWSYHLKEAGAKTSFWVGSAGVFMIAAAALPGSGEAVLNNYVPTIVSPLFFTGLMLFFVAFSVNVFGYLKYVRSGFRSESMVYDAISVSLVISLVMIFSVVISFALLWSDSSNTQVYFEKIFWTPGHIQQVLNGAMLIIVWYALLGKTIENEPEFPNFLKVANKMLILSTITMLGMLFLMDPLDRASRIGSEVIYAIGLGIPLFMHIWNILKQYKFDKSKPASVSLLISIIIYLFGIFIAYGGFGNDTRVPAHYHGAVTALTLALMGFGYHMVKESGVKIYFEKIARSQPYVYGVGMVMFIAGLFVSGLHGAPRTTHGVAWTDDPIVLGAMTLMGVGTLLAVAGGIMFVFYIGITVIKEKRAMSDNGNMPKPE